MKLTKDLRGNLKNRDFYNLYDIACVIADYEEGKHQDLRYIPNNRIWELAEKYVRNKKMYLEDEEWTRKRDTNKSKNKNFYFH